jgi:hypothetical protein
MKVEDIESKVKERLLIRGFSSNRILNNVGLVSATIDETIDLTIALTIVKLAEEFKQKQADINELVEFIKEKEYNFESKEYHKAQLLIEKHK